MCRGFQILSGWLALLLLAYLPCCGSGGSGTSGSSTFCVGAFATDTLVSLPDGSFQLIGNLTVGYPILGGPNPTELEAAQVTYSSTHPNVGQSLAFIYFGEASLPGLLIADPLTCFPLSDGSLVTAENLVAGESNLIDQNGDALPVLDLLLGPYAGNTQSIGIASPNTASKNSGNYFLANGVVSTDYYFGN